MRFLRNRVLTSIVAVMLLCAMGTSAQAGVVPWLWNFMFGPANAPLFPRAYAARRFGRPYAANYAYVPPAASWTPAVSYGSAGYAPAYAYSTYGCGTCTDYTASYAPAVVSYSPVVSYGTMASSDCCGVTTFEYSGYVTNSCGTVYNGVITDGTIVGGTVTDGTVVDKTKSEYEGDPPAVTDPPAIDDDRPAPGTGMGDDNGLNFEAPVNRGTIDPIDDIDAGTLFNGNKPVLDENAEEPPSTTAPGPDAKRIRTLPTTVSLKGELGRYTKLRRTVNRTRVSDAQRHLRWISVPSDGSRARL